jgi:mannose-6-phosphate isomerase-like protein (cupin superfamily)
MSSVTANPTISKFSIRHTPLLASGISTDPLAISDNLWIHAKVYAAGGENGLHFHPEEDHAFFVLQGRAVFEGENGDKTEVGPFDGVLLAKGTRYRFQSVSEENLVMLRIGGAQRDANDRDREGVIYPAPMAVRAHADGTPFPGDSAENRTGALPPVAVPGAYFPDGRLA